MQISLSQFHRSALLLAATLRLVGCRRIPTFCVPSPFGSVLADLFDGDCDSALSKMVEMHTVSGYNPAFNGWLGACLLYAGRAGDIDEALHWLSRTIEMGFINHRFFAEHDARSRLRRERAADRRASGGSGAISLPVTVDGAREPVPVAAERQLRHIRVYPIPWTDCSS